jgi:hypothetical protein
MPLPAIEDVFQKLGDLALFFVMDITKAQGLLECAHLSKVAEIHSVYPSEYWAL